MCTPQIQQAVEAAQLMGQRINSPAPSQDITGAAQQYQGQIGQRMNSPAPSQDITNVAQQYQGFDPRQNDPRYADKFGATASQISELFDPRTGQVIRQVGPPKEMQIVPISRAEFDEEGPVMSDSINSIPQHMMRKQYAPIPLEQPIRRSPTVGELLGIKPGQYEEVGGPGDFRNLNVPLR